MSQSKTKEKVLKSQPIDESQLRENRYNYYHDVIWFVSKKVSKKVVNIVLYIVMFIIWKMQLFHHKYMNKQSRYFGSNTATRLILNLIIKGYLSRIGIIHKVIQDWNESQRPIYTLTSMWFWSLVGNIVDSFTICRFTII